MNRFCTQTVTIVGGICGRKLGTTSTVVGVLCNEPFTVWRARALGIPELARVVLARRGGFCADPARFTEDTVVKFEQRRDERPGVHCIKTRVIPLHKFGGMRKFITSDYNSEDFLIL